MLILLLQISFFIALLLFSTRKMANYSKVVARLAGISESVVGFFMLSVLTSMPEVIMSITAVAYVGDVNLCGGNIFGSNLFNLSIFAFLNIFVARGTLFEKIPPPSNKALWLGLGLACLPFLGKILPWAIGPVSLITVLIWLCYAWISRNLDLADEDKEPDEHLPDTGLKQAIVKLVCFSLLMIISALVLTILSDKLSAITGWGQTFVGALLLAVVSSLPEMGISFHLIKLKAAEMVFGNILGSNFFNICILGLADLFVRGSLYTQLNHTHMATYTGILIQSLILTYIFMRSGKGYMMLSWLIGSTYLATMYALFRLG